MKIKQLDIAGFRSLKNVSWQPGDLNVVIGQNGTGKSNLLRMLELIAVSAQSRLSKYVQMSGGMESILWDGVAASISVDLKTFDPDFRCIFELARFGYTNSYSVSKETVAVKQLTDIQAPLVVTSFDRNSGDSSQEIELLNTGGQDLRQDELWFGLLPSHTAGAPSLMRVRNKLSRIFILQDVNVGQDAKIRQAVVSRFEKHLESDGQNLIAVLHTLYTGDREFKRSIDSAMRAAFGGDYEELVFPPAADQRVHLRLRWKTLRREQSAADLSDGTLRYLLLLTVLTAPDSPMLIAIDEPETGLHPTMLPIIAEFAVEASSRTQVVFTTHSPQFLDAFTDTKPTTTVARWENGETLLNTLDGEELRYWLAEYSLGELFRSGELEALTT
ncbi:MAG: AAA family ATPase [Acidobacteria bacterium]|nr:AAA family ATPase [Acidobacteriota bacterium]MBI3423899.1 AAA family ATPase [Acidobacteriota bacterium]